MTRVRKLASRLHFLLSNMLVKAKTGMRVIREDSGEERERLFPAIPLIDPLTTRTVAAHSLVDTNRDVAKRDKNRNQLD